MGNYHKMLKHYKEKGLFSETKMWESIECLDDILEEMKEKNPDMFWDFMRNQHEIFCGPHFDEKFAKWQVEQMYHKDDDGKDIEANTGALPRLRKYIRKINQNYLLEQPCLMFM